MQIMCHTCLFMDMSLFRFLGLVVYWDHAGCLAQRGGGSTRATQDENDSHERVVVRGSGGRMQAQDDKFLRALILPRFLIPG